MGLSKLAAKCRTCPFVDRCGHKEMEAVGFLPEPSMAEPASQSVSNPVTEPILRETMVIHVNGKPQVVYKDEIKRQLTRGLYQHLGLKFGA